MADKYEMLWNQDAEELKEISQKELAKYFYSLALDWLYCNIAPENMEKAIENEIEGITSTFHFLHGIRVGERSNSH